MWKLTFCLPLGLVSSVWLYRHATMHSAQVASSDCLEDHPKACNCRGSRSSASIIYKGDALSALLWQSQPTVSKQASRPNLRATEEGDRHQAWKTQSLNLSGDLQLTIGGRIAPSGGFTCQTLTPSASRKLELRARYCEARLGVLSIPVDSNCWRGNQYCHLISLRRSGSGSNDLVYLA